MHNGQPLRPHEEGGCSTNTLRKPRQRRARGVGLRMLDALAHGERLPERALRMLALAERFERRAPGVRGDGLAPGIFGSRPPWRDRGPHAQRQRLGRSRPWDPTGIARRMSGWSSPSMTAFRLSVNPRLRQNQRRGEQCVGVCALSGRTGFPRVADDWTEGSAGSLD